jgi:hypothetical protein
MTPSLNEAGTDACMELLGHDAVTDTDILRITYIESPVEWQRRWNRHHTAQPHRCAIVNVGDSGHLAGEESDEFDADVWAHKTVENPADLTTLGIEISELFSTMTSESAGADSTVVCFDSLTTLLQYADLRNAFRFLHVVTGRIKAAGAVGHYHLDPEAHDNQTVATIKGLFDAVVQIDEQGNWSVQMR